MNIGGIIGGTIAAVIGAVVWGAIAFYGEVEIGWLAIGIGFLVGLGVSAGSRSGGIGAALIAVVLTVLSLVGGKYAAVQMAAHKLHTEIGTFEMTDEILKLRLANEQVDLAMTAGKQLRFRNGKNYDNAESLSDFPAEIAKTAQRQFDAMSEDERTAKKEAVEREFEEIVGAVEADFAQKGLAASFGPMDIVFFLLAILAAGKVALSDVIDS
ncbi:hypothetical protein N9Y42_09800 [Mariniblastus sp.]|nr:hypothetical protein [Mariniblastus sp.]